MSSWPIFQMPKLRIQKANVTVHLLCSHSYPYSRPPSSRCSDVPPVFPLSLQLPLWPQDWLGEGTMISGNNSPKGLSTYQDFKMEKKNLPFPWVLSIYNKYLIFHCTIKKTLYGHPFQFAYECIFFSQRIPRILIVSLFYSFSGGGKLTSQL